ncbi:MAG: hypothetical protein JWL80_596 [Parcubacteria group bacterium]|nr:hypothetical protein [Parcubacteria group bacterium]
MYHQIGRHEACDESHPSHSLIMDTPAEVPGRHPMAGIPASDERVAAFNNGLEDLANQQLDECVTAADLEATQKWWGKNPPEQAPQ